MPATYHLLSRTCKLSPDDAEAATIAALERLRDARNLLREAGCPKTLTRVLAAIRSCEGAVRAVSHRRYHVRQEVARGAD